MHQGIQDTEWDGAWITKSPGVTNEVKPKCEVDTGIEFTW